LVTQIARWPNDERIAVLVTVMLEVWSEGKSPMTTSLKPGTPTQEASIKSTKIRLIVQVLSRMRPTLIATIATPYSRIEDKPCTISISASPLGLLSLAHLVRSRRARLVES
jgi:hypothetical protein